MKTYHLSEYAEEFKINVIDDITKISHERKSLLKITKDTNQIQLLAIAFVLRITY